MKLKTLKVWKVVIAIKLGSLEKTVGASLIAL